MLIGGMMFRFLSISAAVTNEMSPKSASTTKTKSKLNGTRVLSEHVSESMSQYFEALNGTAPSDIYKMVIEQVENPLFRAVLDYSEGNQSQAADILGINRGTLRKKLKQYGIEA